MRSLSLLFILSAQAVFAQLDLPELSPPGRVVDKVGYTEMKIEYGRPAARGRRIMGGVVSYDRLWRTGAGRCTRLSFDTEVIISGKPVPAGTYALVTIPREGEWTVLLNRDTSKVYGAPEEYDEAMEVVSFTVTPERTARFVESLTMFFDVVRNDAEFCLMWENTMIRFPIGTGSDAKAREEIEGVLRDHPNSVDALAQAAYYYERNGLDSDQVLSWLNRALSIREDRWVYHQKIDLLDKRGDYAEARATAVRAIAFLRRQRPDGDGWQHSISQIEAMMSKWPEK